ncbi:MAG: protein phosphatase 2C domain-containing protein, partial [Deltaproteobacteria bacterium]|nr:protein phosphatase 2C domain-containing protein [Deltaproteobacteria bacterium]
MAGRASIVGAAATHVGKVREHNEDAHFFDADTGVFLVCDGMGGHAAGEVASAIAIRTIRNEWSSAVTHKLIDGFMDGGSPDVKKQLLGSIRAGVVAAHDSILAEARRDLTKKGMGTTLVGAVIVGNELVFAHAGDSRAYLVRDAIALQLTEDHTLLARLLAAGIDVDQSGEGSRFKSMLTNALGIGEECKVSTFVVPLADGDRFLLCSDGISEYVPEHEVGEVLTKQPSPARAAQKLIELALERGGADNATAIVVRVLEAGETPQPAETIKRDEEVIRSCSLWSAKVTPQQRLRALRIAIARDHVMGERLPAYHLGDRVAWIVVEGRVVQVGAVLEAGTLLYPESLVADSQAPDRESLAVARTDVRALALRADDFRELCEDDSELAEVLLESLAPLIKERAEVLFRARSDRADTQHDAETQDAIAAAHTKPDEAPIDAPQQPPRPRRAQSPVSVELDERFDAVTATPVPG